MSYINVGVELFFLLSMECTEFYNLYLYWDSDVSQYSAMNSSDHTLKHEEIFHTIFLLDVKVEYVKKNPSLLKYGL